MDAKEHEDQNYIGELYDELEPYLVTDMRRGRMINEAWKARNYERVETITPEGTHGVDEYGFATFEADPTALQELVLELFYEPV